jgi:hypothetical protein
VFGKEKNHIATLISSDGVSNIFHEGKVGLFLEASKARLGTSEPTTNDFNKRSFWGNSVELSFLEMRFTHKDIHDVLHDFPSNKSPEPDGFNAEFLRKCWPIVKNDYRSISLLDCRLKISTKLVANRLKKVIMQLTHANQYGFIKSRTIQDCLSPFPLCFLFLLQIFFKLLSIIL